jgi:hypothetical protein
MRIHSLFASYLFRPSTNKMANHEAARRLRSLNGDRGDRSNDDGLQHQVSETMRNTSVCPFAMRIGGLSNIQSLQQHLEQFVAHIRGALSTTAARFAHMRGVP